MQRVASKSEFFRVLRRPARCDEFEIKRRIGAINFIAHHRMAGMGDEPGSGAGVPFWF